MLRVITDDHDLAMSLDDLALLADLFNGRFYLHGYQPFLNLFRTPSDATLIQVVNRNFNSNAITGQYLDIIHTQLAGDVGNNHMFIRQLYLEGRIGQSLNDNAFKFDYIIFRQNNPSLPYKMLTLLDRRSELRINHGQIDHLITDQRDGVLVMGGQRAVNRFHGPAVGQLPHLIRADVNHRFDGERHTITQTGTAPLRSEVRNVGGFVEVYTDAVANVALDGREAILHDVRIDRVADITHTVTHAESGDTAEEAFTRDVDQLLRLGRDCSHTDGARCVTVYAIPICANIDLDDITRTDHTLLGRYAMDDLIIDADARASGEAGIAEERRSSTCADDIIVNDLIELVGGNSLAQGITGGKKRLTRDPTCVLHSRNLNRVFNRDHTLRLNGIQSGEDSRRDVLNGALTVDADQLTAALVESSDGLSDGMIGLQSVKHRVSVVICTNVQSSAALIANICGLRGVVDDVISSSAEDSICRLSKIIYPYNLHQQGN